VDERERQYRQQRQFLRSTVEEMASVLGGQQWLGVARVRQAFEQSSDDGKTWKTSFEGFYVRKH
jgi:hypothetical protein